MTDEVTVTAERVLRWTRHRRVSGRSSTRAASRSCRFAKAARSKLVILAPGVTNTTDLRSRKAAFNNGLSQFSTDGSGEKKNDFTIDGVPNVAADRVAYSPPSAAVEEFKIHTTTYDASIGNTMGAVVNLVTKSGSNKIEGPGLRMVPRREAGRAAILRQARGAAEAGLRRQPVRRRARRAARRASARSTSPTSRATSVAGPAARSP